MSDQDLALNKTTPDGMRQIRVAARGTTDVAIPVGRVNSLYVVSDAACWLKVDSNSDAHTFAKAASAAVSSDDSYEFKHPGGGASFPIIQELEFTHLHCVADTGTVDVEIYPGGITNA